MPDARLDDVSGAEVALDRLRLGRRLDDDESLDLACGLAGRGHLRSSLRVEGGPPQAVLPGSAVMETLRSVTVPPVPCQTGKVHNGHSNGNPTKRSSAAWTVMQIGHPGHPPGGEPGRLRRGRDVAGAGCEDGRQPARRRPFAPPAAADRGTG